VRCAELKQFCAYERLAGATRTLPVGRHLGLNCAHNSVYDRGTDEIPNRRLYGGCRFTDFRFVELSHQEGLDCSLVLAIKLLGNTCGDRARDGFCGVTSATFKKRTSRKRQHQNQDQILHNLSLLNWFASIPVSLVLQLTFAFLIALFVQLL
jgi:hypothetical protein